MDIAIPWDAVSTIQTRTRSLASSRTVQLDQAESGPVLQIGISQQTNVDVALRHPTAVPLPKGGSEPITELRFFADDPHTLVRRAREHLKTEAATPRRSRT